MTNSELCIQIGVKIREIRKSKGISLESLALEAGIAYAQLSRIEHGKINTSVHQLYKICKVLKVDVFHSFFTTDLSVKQ